MTAKMHVMHLRASNFVGGPERQILEHLKRLDLDSFQPVLCSFEQNCKPSELLAEGAKQGVITERLTSNTPFDVRLFLQLRKLLQKHTVNLLIAHGYKSNIYGYLASKSLSIPMIVYSHGWTGESKLVCFYEYLDRQVLRFVPTVVAVSHGHKQQLLDMGVRASKVETIHNAVFVPETKRSGVLKNRYGLPQNARIVLSAGRLSPEKNFSGFVQAASRILRKYEDVYFLVLGEGPERESLERQIERTGLVGRFFLPGFVDDVQALLPDAHIFVSSSHTEGLPVAVLEAAGAGLPVIATDVGGTREAVLNDQTGILVPKEDMTALSHAIESLLNNPEKAAAMGNEGARLVRDQFNFEAQAIKLESLYRGVTGWKR